MAGNKNTLKRKSAKKRHVSACKDHFMRWFENSDIDQGILDAAFDHCVGIEGIDIIFECWDNFRVADASNPEQVKEYRRRQKDGCCGFYDTAIEVGKRHAVMVGFNYGH
jgi:hypothetical protein